MKITIKPGTGITARRDDGDSIQLEVKEVIDRTHIHHGQIVEVVTKDLEFGDTYHFIIKTPA